MKNLLNIFKKKELPLVVGLDSGITTYIDKRGHVHVIDQKNFQQFSKIISKNVAR